MVKIKKFLRKVLRKIKRGLKKIAKKRMSKKPLPEENVVKEEAPHANSVSIEECVVEECAVETEDDGVITAYCDDVVMDIDEKDKNKVWAFCAGQYSGDFRGNPKWLFIYMNNYRKDVSTYWLAPSKELALMIRGFGFKAYILGTVQAEEAMNRTGVFVAEMVKAAIPEGLRHAKYLNLWHGVGGVKAVERAYLNGRLTEEIAKKYIEKNEYYLSKQIYLAPSDIIHDIAVSQIGVPEERIIHAGYPRCMYQKLYKEFSSFDHDLIGQRDLPEDTRIVVYAPTYRNEPSGELFAQSFPELGKLIDVCEEQHILFVFKMHPLLEDEMSFREAANAFSDCKWLCFWDNQNDFYEIMDKVDLCIMDYSSIFTDFVAAGVKHFIRYIIDFDPENLDFPLGYDEATIGQKCYCFEELLESLKTYKNGNMIEDIERIQRMHWQYADENSFDRIIDETMAIEVGDELLPTLYSFDIFDTLISRRVLAPEGIFYKVREWMEKSELEFPSYLVKNYPEVRKNAELNVREYYNRSKVERDDDRCEIQFDHIFDRLSSLYGLSSEQVEALKNWELEAEYEDSIPIKERIEYVKQLLEQGEKVILISDMYLPKAFIQKLLEKADRALLDVQLYLSSEYGYQKSSRNLYIEVYKEFEGSYNFGQWIHCGDNARSDFNIPRSLKIKTNRVIAPSFNDLEKELVSKIQTYDAYLIAASMARFREQHLNSKAEFVYSYVSMIFVPYVYWAIHDALNNGDKIVYFISRDGHHLKRIADAIIEQEGLNLQTKYIYASRRTWRVPSFIDHIDVGFWGQGYGNFANVESFGKLLKALNMDKEAFYRIFPELGEMGDETDFSEIDITKLTDIFKASKKYEEYLLDVAEQGRKTVCAYLKQEMDTSKQFSIIEYWGRGYTQENFTRLWHEIVGEQVPVTFYYSRSTLPSDQYNIRKNFTSYPGAQQYIESIFANIPYKSIEEYQKINGRWEPVIAPLDCDKELFYDMTEYLPQFAELFCTLPFNNRLQIGRELIDFAMDYYSLHQESALFVDNLAPLVDSVMLYGDKKEYAKELTGEDIENLKQGIARGQISKSITMSYYRSSEEIQEQFNELFQIGKNGKPTDNSPLTEEEIERYHLFEEKKNTLTKRLSKFHKLYNYYVSEHEVKNKIVFLTNTNSVQQVGYAKLKTLLSLQTKFEVRDCRTKGKGIKLEDIAFELATAKFVILDRPVDLLSQMSLRAETKTILSVPTATKYLANGLATKYKLSSERVFNALILNNQYDVLQVPSMASKDLYVKTHSINELTQYQETGSCATDIYFDDAYITGVKEKLLEKYPQVIGKKVICYVPYHRYRNETAEYMDFLDIERLSQSLRDDYILLVCRMAKNKLPISNKLEVENFAFDVTDVLSVQECIIAADIVVGDYRDTVFDVPIMHKPLFLTVWDLEEFENKKNVLCSFNDMFCGVRINSTEELILQIQNIDSYDYSNMDRFREKYLTYCDGKSSERLYEFIMK